MKKFLTLRPWHFDKGTSFSLESFFDYQRKAQKWADSAWIFFTIISIIPFAVLSLSISLPRARKAQAAAARLGVTRQEIDIALNHLKNASVAYEPSQEELDRWESTYANDVRNHEEESARKKPQKMKVWGIVLSAMGGVVGIKTISGLVIGSAAEDDIGATLAGMALFIGVGVYLIYRSKKLVSNKKERLKRNSL